MGVETTHPQYDSREHQWKVMRDTSAGEDAVKNAGSEYLPKLGGQENDQYSAYKTRASYYNATGRTIDGLTGMIFRKPPVVERPNGMDTFMEDVTLDGLGFQSFAEMSVDEVITVGRAGVLVDFPETPEDGVTKAIADQMGLRPFWRLVKGEHILNWRTSRIGTRTLLTEVRLWEEVEEDGEKEFESSFIPQIRVLDLVTSESGVGIQYRQRVFRKIDDTAEWVQVGEDIFPLMNNRPMEFIPFIFLGPRDTSADLSKPPLIDLAWVNLSHYRTSADLEHGAHFTALPTPYIFGVSDDDAPDTIGPEVIWHSEDSEVNAGMLEFEGTGLQSLEKRLEVKEQEMASLGARMLAPDKRMVEAVETAQIHRQGETSILSSIAQAVSIGLTEALTIARDWMSLGGDVDVKLNTDFFPSPISPQLLQVLFQMVQAGRISNATFFENLQRGEIIDAEKSLEDELAEIETDGGGLDPLRTLMSDSEEDEDDEDEEDI